MLRKKITAGIVAACLVVPGVATAQTTAVDAQYEERTAPVVAGEAVAPEPADTVGELPFTGAELGMIALAGVAILGSGLALRRIGARTRNQSRTNS